MSAPPSPDQLPAMPEYLPILPDDPYFEAIDYDDEEEPYEDLVNEVDSDEDPEMDWDINIDDYEEDPEMDIDIDGIEEAEEQIVVPHLSPLTSPPPISETSSDSNHSTPTRFPKSTYEMGGSSATGPMFKNSTQYDVYRLKHDLNTTQFKVQDMAWQMDKQESIVNAAKTEAMHARHRLDLFILDMSYVKEGLTHVEDIVLDPLAGLENVKDRLTRVEKAQNQDATQIHKLLHYLNTMEIRLDVANFDRYHLRKKLYDMQSQMYAMQQELYQKEVKENRPDESVDVLATYGDTNPSELQQTFYQH